MGDEDYDNLFTEALAGSGAGRRSKRRGGDPTGAADVSSIVPPTAPSLDEFTRKLEAARSAAALAPGSLPSAEAQEKLAALYARMQGSRTVGALLKTAMDGYKVVKAIQDTAVSAAVTTVEGYNTALRVASYLIAAARARPGAVIGATALATTGAVLKAQEAIEAFKGLPDADTKKQVFMWFVYIGNFLNDIKEVAVFRPYLTVFLLILVAIAGDAIARKKDEIWNTKDPEVGLKELRAEFKKINDQLPGGLDRLERKLAVVKRRGSVSQAALTNGPAAPALADGSVQGGRRRSTSRRRRRAAYLPRQTRRSSSGRRRGYSRRQRG
jgi:hypothetical protein